MHGLRLLNALLLTILLLEGCGVTTTIVILEERVKACRKAGGDCAEVEKALDKRIDRQYRDAENAQRWETCKLIYARFGRPMRTDHDHKRWRTHNAMDVKIDLSINNCRMILKQLKLW